MAGRPVAARVIESEFIPPLHIRELRELTRYRESLVREQTALVAIGHSILVIVYHVLKNKASYQELGGDYFDQRDAEKRRQRLIHQLESLGLKVTVEELAQAA